MPKPNLPYIQFYVRDYLSSRAVAAMHPTARGGYVHLLCHAWLGDRPGWLPDDDKLLAALSGLGERWPEHRDSIARAWRIRKGWWVQPKLVASRRAYVTHRRRKSEQASAAARKRWDAEGKMREHSGRNAKTCLASASASASASEARSGEAQPRLTGKGRRRKAEPALEVTPDQVQAAALRFNLPLDTVRLLAERVVLEAPQRGYVNAHSAFLNWCRIERERVDRNGTDKPSRLWSQVPK